MARYIIIILFSLHFLNIFSKDLTIEDIVKGNYAYYNTQLFSQILWRGSAETFLYCDKGSLFEVNVNDLNSKQILQIEEINILTQMNSLVD